MVMKHETAALWEVVVTEKRGEYTWCRLYWSSNRGKDGYQIVWERCIDGGEFETGQTGGGGYCRESAAFANFIEAVLGRYPGRVAGFRPCQFARLFLKDGCYRGGNYIEMTRQELEDAVTLANQER